MTLAEIIQAGFTYRVMLERDEVPSERLEAAVQPLDRYYPDAQHADYLFIEQDDVFAFFFKRRDMAITFVTDIELNIPVDELHVIPG